MIVDACKLFRENAEYNKIIGDDYLFIEFKCPIDIEDYHMWLDSHCISYVISGRKDWHTSKRTYSISVGDALFMKRGVYTTKQYFEEDYCVLLFFINDDFIRKFLSDNPSLRLPINNQQELDQIDNVDTNDSFQTIIQSIFFYFKQGSDVPQNLIKLKVRELIFNIILNPKNKSIANFFGQIHQSSKTDIENVMLKNFHHDLDMSAFAKLSGRSLSKFKRDFKRLFEQSPGKWLQEKRLDRAKTLLMGSDLNIQEIGFECGFKNASHFNKSFKEKFQYSPNKFRHQFAQSA